MTLPRLVYPFLAPAPTRRVPLTRDPARFFGFGELRETSRLGLFHETAKGVKWVYTQ